MAVSSSRTALAALLGATLTVTGATVGAAADDDVAPGVCGALTSLSLLDGTTLCTHGSDDHLQPADTSDVPQPPLTSTATADVPLADVLATVPADTAPLADVPTTLPADTAPLADVPTTAPAATVELDNHLLGTVLSPAPAAHMGLRAQAARGQDAEGNAVDGAVPSLPANCIGNGVDGHRVEVLALDVNGSTIEPATDADIRRWAGQVTWTFRATAQRDGADRNVRWVTSPAGKGCEVKVTRVRMTAGEVDGFQRTIEALANRGFADTDRKYLAFANVSNGICGIGTIPLDDRAGDVNTANSVAGYSRIDAPCWTTGDTGFYSVAAHELTHNLGGVQNSAPNASGGYHCTDQWDLMCYADGLSDVSHTCEDANTETRGEGDHNNRLLDCNGDDYFNASTHVTGYLASHWNVADSLFLDGRPAAPAAQNQDETPPAQSPPAEQDTAEAARGTASRAVHLLVDWVLRLVRELTGAGILGN